MSDSFSHVGDSFIEVCDSFLMKSDSFHEVFDSSQKDFVANGELGVSEPMTSSGRRKPLEEARLL